MRVASLILAIGVLWCEDARCQPQTGLPPLTVAAEASGLVRVSSGQRKIQVDIRKEASGCFGTLFDGSTGERVPSDGQVKLIDATDKAGHYYVLLTASAPPNCNVQGQCGASPRPDTTVIWLKLAPDLSIEETRNFVVEDCRAGRSVEQEPDDWAARVRLIDGKLVLVFREYGQGRNGADVTGRLEYERAAPERGIQVSRPVPGGS